MKKLTKENDGLLIGALMFGYYQVIKEDLCSTGREAYSYLESFIAKELEPFLDENYQVELEGYGIFSFQERDYNGRLYDFWKVDAMEEVRV